MQNKKMSFKCPNCKTYNPVGEKHCLNCGKWLLETSIKPFTYVPRKRNLGFLFFVLQFIVFIALFSILFLNKIKTPILSLCIILSGTISGIYCLILLFRKLITDKGTKVKVIVSFFLIALEVMFLGITISPPQGIISTVSYKQPSLNIYQFEKSSILIPYDRLTVSAESYKGKHTCYEGVVLGDALDGSNDIRVNVAKVDTYGYRSENSIIVVKRRDSAGTLHEGDQIKLWCEVDGYFTYKTVLGQQISLPKVSSYYITTATKK